MTGLQVLEVSIGVSLTLVRGPVVRTLVRKWVVSGIASLLGASWGIFCIIDASHGYVTTSAVFPGPLEHPCEAGIGPIVYIVLLLVSLLSCRAKPRVVGDLAGEDEVGLISQRPVRLQTVLYQRDIRTADRLWFVQDEVLVLAIEAKEFAFVVQIEVGLHGIEEHDWVLAGCLQYVVHNVLGLQVVELS